MAKAAMRGAIILLRFKPFATDVELVSIKERTDAGLQTYNLGGVQPAKHILNIGNNSVIIGVCTHIINRAGKQQVTHYSGKKKRLVC
jgi:hypothetical protein